VTTATFASKVLDDTIKTIDARLAAITKELEHQREEFAKATEPLTQELSELQDVRSRITGESTRPTATRPRTANRTTNGTERSARAPRGQNAARILDVVAERPGVSAAQVAEASGLAKPTVATALSKLAQDGRVQREELSPGRVGWKLP